VHPRRPPPDREVSATADPAIARELQKRETLHLTLTTLYQILLGKKSKFDQPRLLSMKFQSKLGQPFPELFQEAICLAPVLDAQHVQLIITEVDTEIATYFRPGEWKASKLDDISLQEVRVALSSIKSL